jgi:hypothetical protein
MMLRESYDWSSLQFQVQVSRADPRYIYNGWEQNSIAQRFLIIAFLNNAKWFRHGKIR